MLTPEEQDELQRLVHAHLPIRAMARRLNRDVKTIRRALGRSPRPSARAPSKLAPYHALITERVQQGLRAPRILREIRERGYTGGPTILKALLRTLRPPQPPAPRRFHRFETGLAEEAQSDWSPYRVTIAPRERIVHAFSLILCYSRRLFVAFFREERLPTLLWAHQAAFRYHDVVRDQAQIFAAHGDPLAVGSVFRDTVRTGEHDPGAHRKGRVTRICHDTRSLVPQYQRRRRS